MDLFNKIIKESKKVDNLFKKLDENDMNSVRITFQAPSFHPRYKDIKEYSFSEFKIENLTNHALYKKSNSHIFIIANAVSKQEFMTSFFSKNNIKPLVLESVEDKVKIKSFIEHFIKENDLEEKKEACLVIIIGGGLILNVGAYIAEKLSSNLILFPTTVLSLADGAGGKVRANTIAFNKSYKHYYKSFYEPDEIFLDDRFLDSLPEQQIQIGLVEIIKHGLFQSTKLQEYLITSGKELFKNKQKLKKAIFWAANLKKVCLEIDVEENENGSRKILRAGHDFSDRLEEQMNLKIPHGYAVAIGIIKQLTFEENYELLDNAKKMFDLFGIPKSVEEFNSLE